MFWKWNFKIKKRFLWKIKSEVMRDRQTKSVERDLYQFVRVLKKLIMLSNISIMYLYVILAAHSKRPLGLGVWFLLWVQEVPGSNPGGALLFFAIHTALIFIEMFMKYHVVKIMTIMFNITTPYKFRCCFHSTI